MKYYSVYILLFIAVLSSNYVLAQAESPKSEMRDAFTALNELQPYLNSAQKFESPQSARKILDLIQQLQASFHKVSSEKQKLSTIDSMREILFELEDLLSDAQFRFKEGKKDYSLWRLRAVSNYCTVCHTRYGSEANWGASDALESSNSLYEKGSYLVATRQFEKAKGVLLRASLDETNRLERMDALRKWLLILVRVQPNPKRAINDLEALLESGKFSSYDAKVLTSWKNAFESWLKEGSGTSGILERANKLIGSGDSKDVDLLRATSLLHRALESEHFQNRPEALLLLAKAYENLPLFFRADLAKLFYKRCIDESPDTNYAIQAYGRYRALTELDYTGSKGTQIPAEVELQLSELEAKAEGTVKSLPSNL